MEKMTAKQITHKRALWYTISRFISRGGAVFGVGMTYGLFIRPPVDEPNLELTGMASFTLIILFFFFYQDIKSYAMTKAETVWNDSVDEAKWLFVILMLLAFTQWAKMGIGSLEVLLLYIGGAQALALYPSIKHRQYVRLAINKEGKRKEDI